MLATRTCKRGARFAAEHVPRDRVIVPAVVDERIDPAAGLLDPVRLRGEQRDAILEQSLVRVEDALGFEIEDAADRGHLHAHILAMWRVRDLHPHTEKQVGREQRLAFRIPHDVMVGRVAARGDHLEPRGLERRPG